MNKRIALGTVQFGLQYGIANQAGRVSPGQARDILTTTYDSGIDTLDTAIAYGDSEQTLGQLGVAGWHIITKLPELPEAETDISAWARHQVTCSLARLGVNHLHAVLLHRPEQLLSRNGEQLLSALQQLKHDGYTSKIGVSIYSPDALPALFSLHQFDLVQAPLNLLDRRLIETGWAQKLKAMDVELHVRSAFLQGLLLMDLHERPARFAPWQPLWEEWDAWLKDNSMTAVQACIRYALSVREADKIVVGVDHQDQLREILAATQGATPPFPEWSQYMDARLINPACWNQL